MTTDDEKLAEFDECIAVLKAERKMHEAKARATSGLLAIDCEYAKVRIPQIDRQLKRLVEERADFVRKQGEYWDGLLGPVAGKRA